LSSREVYFSLWREDLPGEIDSPVLEFGYTEGDADEMDFEEWRATRLEGFVEGLNSLMEAHDFVKMERVK
jgi:hypothetical protein